MRCSCAKPSVALRGRGEDFGVESERMEAVWSQLLPRHPASRTTERTEAKNSAS